MKPILPILFLGVTFGLQAQIRWERLIPIAPDDVAMPALRGWQQKIVDHYEGSGRLRAEFGSWAEMSFPSLKKTFPRWRFFANTWSEYPAPGKESEPVGRALGIETVLVCDADGKLLKEVPTTGNYEPFGSLLASRRISIRTADEAGLVWEAFCDLHQKHWQVEPAVQISESIWHLGNKTIDGTHYYYEVQLDGSQIVTSAKLRSDDLKQPKSN